MKNYNSWTNWDTWNTNLHLTNNELILYLAESATSPEEIRDIFLDHFGDDFDGITLNEVDFQEIFDNIQANIVGA